MMKSSIDVADKAVSTEDLERECDRVKDDEKKKETVTNTALELVRLEAVLSALVENKVVAIKAAAAKPKKSFGRSRQGKPQRLTSTSTASSSHQESTRYPPSHSTHQSPHRSPHRHHHRRHHHYHHRHKRTSDVGLLSSGLFPKRRHRHHYHSRSHHDRDHLPSHHKPSDQFDEEETAATTLRTKSATNLTMTAMYDVEVGSTYSLNGHLIPGPSPYHNGYHNYNYNQAPWRNNTGVSSSSCPSPTHSQSKILSSRCEADHVSINMGGEEDDEEDAARRRRKRRRKRRFRQEQQQQVRPKKPKRTIDPEDLPKRARWTIIATACLLLLMSVLLVGVTLRMAPIIDEMVRKENEQLMNLNRDDLDDFYNTSVTTPSSPTGQSTPPD